MSTWRREVGKSHVFHAGVAGCWDGGGRKVVSSVLVGRSSWLCAGMEGEGRLCLQCWWVGHPGWVLGWRGKEGCVFSAGG